MIEKALRMLRLALYALFFFLLVRLIGRLFSGASEHSTEAGPRLRPDPPDKQHHNHINEAEIEDATFEEITDDTA